MIGYDPVGDVSQASFFLWHGIILLILIVILFLQG